MPLLDLKTDLKSLKYGKDQPGGGNSGQPYQQVDINTVDSGFNRFRMTKFDDGLIRGGVVGAANASIVDTFRIGKWLTDFPKGPLWIVKQVGLQLSNPRLETRKGLAGVTNTFSGDFGSLTNGLLQPTRIYNLGINTLAQVPVNAFGVHLNRHGILPVQDDNTKYLAIAGANNQNTKFEGAGLPFSSSNRLVQKAIDLLPKQSPLASTPLNLIQNFLSRLPFISTFIKPQQQVIDEYAAGPGSVYGIGRTFIRRYDYTTPQDSISTGLINRHPRQAKGVVNYTNVLGVSNDYFIPLQRASANNISNNGNSITPPPSPVKFTPGSSAISKYNQLKNQNDKRINDSSVFNYNPFKNTNLGVGSGFLSGGDLYNGEIKSYSNNNVSYNNGITRISFNGTWKTLNRETRVGSGRKDEINLTPLFNAPAGTISDKQFIIGDRAYNINDLVKFRIQSINTDNPSQAVWMIFRAYLTQLSDSVDAGWNSVKYIGRGENFYVYDGFTRRIQIGFKVAALSAEEMKPMYQKLNYLMGNLMPDYNDTIMRGPLVRMTVGNWIDGQAGIINNLSYNIPNDSPWEIAMAEPLFGEKKLILPHVVEVSMTFTPIGSQTYTNNRTPQKSAAISHIAQNINDTQYINGKIGEIFTNQIKVPPGATSRTVTAADAAAIPDFATG
jgi:hypothetical protein